MPIKNHAATWVGSGALIIWSIEALLISELESFPLFATLCLLFTASFLMTAFRLTLRGAWESVLLQSPKVWLAGLLGVCGADALYIAGARIAPIAHVDLIDYLWPFIVIYFTGKLPGETVSKKHLVGALIGMVGVLILITGGQGLEGIAVEKLPGYAMAIVGALFWGGYCAFSRKMGASVPSEMVGVYCALAAPICLVLHLFFETPRIPTTEEAGIGIFLGIAGAGMAYQFWDIGSKYGNINLLSVLTYLTPIVSMSLLIYYGHEPFSWYLVVACLLVTVGVIVSSVDWHNFFGKGQSPSKPSHGDEQLRPQEQNLTI